MSLPVVAAGLYLGYLAINSTINAIDFHLSTQNLVQQVSKLDGRTYLVLPVKQAEAADLIAATCRNIWHIISTVRDWLQNDPDKVPQSLRSGMRRLIGKYTSASDVMFYELDSTQTKALAFNVGKSSSIFICLRKELDTKVLADEPTILFIALHELSHSAHEDTEPIDDSGFTVHGKRFKEYEQFLFQVAQTIGLLNPQSVIGQVHCGSKIANPATAL